MNNEFSYNLMSKIVKLEGLNPILFENPGFVSIVEELAEFLSNLDGIKEVPVISGDNDSIGFDFSTAYHKNFYFKCISDVDGSLMYDFSEHFKKGHESFIKYNQGKISLLEDGSLNYRKVEAHVDEFYFHKLAGVRINKTYNPDGIVENFEQRDVNVPHGGNQYWYAVKNRKKMSLNHYFGNDGLCVFPFYDFFNVYNRRVDHWDRKIVATRTDLNKAVVNVFGWTLSRLSVGDDDFSMEVPLNIERSLSDMILPETLDLVNYYKNTEIPRYLESITKKDGPTIKPEQTRDISYEIPVLSESEKEELILRESNPKIQEGLRTFITETKSFRH